MSVALQSVQAAQQAALASSPEAENLVPAAHGLQVPAAPTVLAEPGRKPMTAASLQQVAFAAQTTLVVVVPRVVTYSVAPHVLWSMQQAPVVSNPLAENLPVAHAGQVPADPAVVSEPTLKSTTVAPAQHVALSPHVDVAVVVQVVA